MNGWLTPDSTLELKLAATLLHFVWQAAAVAIVYAALDLGMRAGKRGAEARYALACAAFGALLLLPVLTYARVAGTERSDFGDGGGAWRAAPLTAPGSLGGNRGPAPGGPFSVARVRDAVVPLHPWIVAGWLGGVLALSIRMLAGLAGVSRLVRHRTSPARGEVLRSFQALARKLGVPRTVRLLESGWARVPAALGVFRPIVLLPVSALSGLDARHVEALLAHELAHVRRHDYLVNLFQVSAETLLFYHPAVWWISTRIRTERENACDDAAVAATGDRRVYATALVELEGLRGGRRDLALAADGGNLLRRITRLFPGRAAPAAPDGRAVAGGFALAAIVAAGAAAHAAAPAYGISIAPPAAETAGSSGPARPADRVRRDPRVSTPAARKAPASLPAATPQASPSPRLESPPAGGDPDPDTSDPRVETATRPAETLSEDELETLRRRGVTPDYLGRLAGLGYLRASVDELVGLRTHGVPTEDIARFQQLLGEVSLDDCTALRIHGVTPEYVRGFRQAGYTDLTADRILSLRIHGASPPDATDLGVDGDRPTLDEIVSARIHGVDGAFARAMRSEGFAHAGVEELVSFRIHGVTPDFVREMRSLAFPDLSEDEAVAFRIHGVTTEFVRQLKALGVPDLSPEGVTGLTIHGWTIERIRRINREAGRRLTVEEIVDEGRAWRTEK